MNLGSHENNKIGEINLGNLPKQLCTRAIVHWSMSCCKNPATCGNTSFRLVPNFGFIFLTFPHFMSNFVDDLVQHCIKCNIALRATLQHVQHCIKCNIALCATLYLCATLHYVQHCITCNIAFVELSSKLWISSFKPSLALHDMLHCITCYIVSVELSSKLWISFLKISFISMSNLGNAAPLV